MNVLCLLTIVMKTQTVRTLMGRFCAHVIVDMLEMVQCAKVLVIVSNRPKGRIVTEICT